MLNWQVLSELQVDSQGSSPGPGQKRGSKASEKEPQSPAGKKVM